MTVEADKEQLRCVVDRLYRAGMNVDRIMKIVTDTIAEVVIEKTIKKEVKG